MTVAPVRQPRSRREGLGDDRLHPGDPPPAMAKPSHPPPAAAPPVTESRGRATERAAPAAPDPEEVSAMVGDGETA